MKDNLDKHSYMWLLFPTGVRISPLDVHNYDFHSILGQGGFGKVMLATFANRKLAVKVIKKGPECNYNSIRIEASVLMMPHLNPFLCQGYSTFETQRHVFMVMDYLSGGSLACHLDYYGSLEPETVLFHSAEIVCGLEFLHSCGIVHRDLKPANILVDQDGHVKISDFGLAVPNMFGNKTIGGRAGTLGYMAPEVLQRKRYNAAVDWFSVGIIICQMASGDSPFYEGNNREKIISSTINDEPRIPRWLNEDLKDLLRKLLEKDPNQRLGDGNIKHHPFFSTINWVELENKTLPPHFHLRAPPMEHSMPTEGNPLSFLL
ncbi:hypothetical protein XELAEV_18042349mg [Xenopus laevis]|uniref:Protein kinase domain-containing protein n=1 Tax=Xenopus laevis TaxID=8355 RepID=A0A974H691_XENLA|nr:hypothetical protein XELAEV_18042349mg [Xenopus laevis]